MEETIYFGSRITDDYLGHCRRRRLAEKTIKGFELFLRVFFTFVRENYPDVQDITDIGKDIILSYEKYLAVRIDDRGKVMSRGRRGKFLSCLKSFYLYLEREEMIYKNPTLNISMPGLKKTIIKDVLSIKEMGRFLKTCTGDSLHSLRDRTVMEILYSTGIRADEFCNICVSDIDLNEGILFIRKGKMGNERYIPFGETASYWIQRYLEKGRPLLYDGGSDLLFVTLRRGNKFTPSVLRNIVKKWAKIAGIEKNVTTHTFRHSCATHMLKGNADIRYVQKQLGHREISTTEKYLKIEIGDLKEVHERTHPREQEDWEEKE